MATTILLDAPPPCDCCDDWRGYLAYHLDPGAEYLTYSGLDQCSATELAVALWLERDEHGWGCPRPLLGDLILAISELQDEAATEVAIEAALEQSEEV